MCSKKNPNSNPYNEATNQGENGFEPGVDHGFYFNPLVSLEKIQSEAHVSFIASKRFLSSSARISVLNLQPFWTFVNFFRFKRCFLRILYRYMGVCEIVSLDYRQFLLNVLRIPIVTLFTKKLWCFPSPKNMCTKSRTSTGSFQDRQGN